jgi:predicted transposase YbfD/YdcC
MMTGLIDAFKELEDYRQAGKVQYPLIEIVVIAVCAVIAGSESWEDIALYAQSKRPWLKGFLALEQGTPSHDTFRQVFGLVKPSAFEGCFRKWAKQLREAKELEGFFEHIVIDGKSLKKSFDKQKEQDAFHLVNVWAAEQRLVLGQHQVDSKTNEISVIPELIRSLNVEHSLVSIDAMGTQKAIAKIIIEQKADYLLTLKANHKHAFKALQHYYAENAFSVGHKLEISFDEFDDSHGRTVRRRVFIAEEAVKLPELADWPALATTLAVESIYGIKGSGKVEAHFRYFISSYQADPMRLVNAIRQHWSIENSLHWVLDVSFDEDQCRIRDEHAAQNFSLLRKMAINILNQDTASKLSLKAKRKKAAWNNDYLTQLLLI